MLITIFEIFGVVADVLTIVSAIVLVVKLVRHRTKVIASRLFPADDSLDFWG